MTAQSAEAPLSDALDPDSAAGRATADAISEFGAEVITRLRREGKAVPGRPHSP